MQRGRHQKPGRRPPPKHAAPAKPAELPSEALNDYPACRELLELARWAVCNAGSLDPAARAAPPHPKLSSEPPPTGRDSCLVCPLAGPSAARPPRRWRWPRSMPRARCSRWVRKRCAAGGPAGCWRWLLSWCAARRGGRAGCCATRAPQRPTQFLAPPAPPARPPRSWFSRSTRTRCTAVSTCQCSCRAQTARLWWWRWAGGAAGTWASRRAAVGEGGAMCGAV